MTNKEIILQGLKTFRSLLFELDLDAEDSIEKLQDVLNKKDENCFEPFAEEILIAGIDVEMVRIANLSQMNSTKFTKSTFSFHFPFS